MKLYDLKNNELMHKHDDCSCGEHGHEHECDCDCGCGCEEEPMIVVMKSEDGKEHEFEIIYSLVYKDKEYAFLVPISKVDDIEEDEMLVYVVKEVFDNGQPSFALEPIESDELLNEVYQAFLKETEKFTE